jgi:hypothetical protein
MSSTLTYTYSGATRDAIIDLIEDAARDFPRWADRQTAAERVLALIDAEEAARFAPGSEQAAS